MPLDAGLIRLMHRDREVRRTPHRIDAVTGRYDLPQRWYHLKAEVLGVDRLADHDRNSSVAETNQHVPWGDAKATVRDAYASFSDELAGIVDRFYDEGWLDAPVREGKRGGRSAPAPCRPITLMCSSTRPPRPSMC